MRTASRNLALSVVAAAIVLAGCGSSAKPGASGTTATVSTVPGGHVAIPVSKDPSTSAKMICEEDVHDEIYGLVGVKISQPLKPTWKDHVYSCTYVYPNGKMTLSVKELADKDETDAYYASLATKLHKRKDVAGFPEGAFITTNDSAVVRKDYKVLTVDAAGLPAQFGNPLNARDAVTLGVASEIMSCWTGA